MKQKGGCIVGEWYMCSEAHLLLHVWSNVSKNHSCKLIDFTWFQWLSIEREMLHSKCCYEGFCFQVLLGEVNPLCFQQPSKNSVHSFFFCMSQCCCSERKAWLNQSPRTSPVMGSLMVLQQPSALPAVTRGLFHVAECVLGWDCPCGYGECAAFPAWQSGTPSQRTELWLNYTGRGQ